MKINIFKFYSELFNELSNYKELILRLFIRDFLGRTKQTFLGIFWIIFMPLFLICGFLFMNKSGVLNLGDIKVPYPIFAILGITIWHLFSQ